MMMMMMLDPIRFISDLLVMRVDFKTALKVGRVIGNGTQFNRPHISSFLAITTSLSHAASNVFGLSLCDTTVSQCSCRYAAR